MPNSQQHPLKLLLVADVHFGKLAASPQFALSGSGALHEIQAAVPMKQHLITSVRSIEPSPQALLVLGDLTSIASPSEFQGGFAAIKEIAAGAAIEPDKVFFTYGNHDVDWRICSLATSTERYPKDVLYSEVAAQVGAHFVRNPPQFNNGPLPGSGFWEQDGFVLYVLNSGYFCVSDQDYRHGKLGQDQLKWLASVLEDHEATPARWRVLMVHHHPFNYPYPTLSKDISTLEEGAELVELVGRFGIDFVCHGHRHHPKLSTQMRQEWKKPVTFFCAGSLAVNETERNSGQIPNLFHLVCFESRLPDDAAFGYLQSFEYAASDGWRPIHNSTETPLDHIQHFGALASDAERTELAKQVVRSLTLGLSGRTPKSVMLPDHPALHPALRCQSAKELNRVLQDAARGAGWKIVGGYPGEVALMRR